MKTIFVAFIFSILAVWIQAPHPNINEIFLKAKLNGLPKKTPSKRLLRGRKFLSPKTDSQIIPRKLKAVTNKWVYERLKPMLSKFPDWANVKVNNFSVKDVSG